MRGPLAIGFALMCFQASAGEVEIGCYSQRYKSLRVNLKNTSQNAYWCTWYCKAQYREPTAPGIALCGTKTFVPARQYGGAIISFYAVGEGIVDDDTNKDPQILCDPDFSKITEDYCERILPPPEAKSR